MDLALRSEPGGERSRGVVPWHDRRKDDERQQSELRRDPPVARAEPGFPLAPKHYLQKWHKDYNADAEKIADKLKQQIQGATTGQPAAQGAQAAQEKSTVIWAEPATNALVITAPPKLMRQLMSVVDRLDIRPRQRADAKQVPGTAIDALEAARRAEITSLWRLGR